MLRIALLIIFSLASYSSFAQNDQIVKKGKGFVYHGEHGLFRTKYDSIRNFSEGRAAVKKEGKWGFINDSGVVITACSYTRVLDFHAGMALVEKLNSYSKIRHWGLIDKNGKVSGVEIYDSIVYLDSFALAYYSHLNNKNRVVCDIYFNGTKLKTIWDVLNMEKRGEVYVINYYKGVCQQSASYSKLIVNRKGVELYPRFGVRDSILKLPCIIWDCWKNTAAVMSSDYTISPWYTDLYAFNDDFYRIKNDKKYGVMKNGKNEIIPAEHDYVYCIGPAFIVTDGKKESLWDTNGVRLTPLCYDVQHLGEGIYRFQYDSAGLVQLMLAGGQKIPGVFSEAYSSRSGIVRVVSADETKYGYINRSGKMIGGWYPREVTYHSNTAQIGNTTLHFVRALMYQRINEKGEIVTDSVVKREIPAYNSSFTGMDFKNGYGIYTVAQKRPNPNPHGEEPALQGVIDSTGKIVAKAVYQSVSIEDTFIVTFDGDYGLRVPSGVQLLPMIYGFVTYIGKGFFKVQQGDFGDYAIYNARERKFVTKFIYDDVDFGGDSIFIVEYNKLKGYVDFKGKQIAPMNFKSAGQFKDGRAKVNPGYLPKEEYYIDKTGKRIE